MSNGVYVRVYAEPKAQPRPRRSASGGVYNPHTADAWKEAVELACAKETGWKCIDGPVSLSVVFFLPTPKRLASIVERVDVPHGCKPDCDNLLKSTMDALTRAGAWKDDAQVAMSTARKLYASSKQPVGAVIFVRPYQ